MKIKLQTNVSFRRWTVVAVYVSYALLMAGMGAGATVLGPVPAAILSVLAGTGLIASLWLLFANTRLWHWGNAPDKDLDERQVQVRNLAYRYAYMGVATLLMCWMMYMAFAVDKGLWLPKSYEQASALVWGVMLLCLTLPSAILAWTEKEIE